MAVTLTTGQPGPTGATGATGPEGPAGATGAQGLPGTAHWVNVLDLHATPASVTDWGALINTAYTNGARHFVFQHLSGGYPFTTQLDFEGSQGVVLEGESGRHWIGDAFLGTEVRSQLVWKNTGSTNFINGRGSSGLTLRDLGIYYDSATFSGHLVDLALISAMSDIRRCHIGAMNNNLVSAASCVNWADAICANLDGCSLFGADVLVRGNNVAHSNANRIHDCVFHKAGTAQIKNIWDQWVIDSCTFEVADSPSVIDGSTGGSFTSSFRFTNNWVGDITGSERNLFKQRSNNTWNAEFSGNTIRQPWGPIFTFAGGGNISIVNNPVLQSNDGTDAIIDLGDTGAGATAFNSVNITGNQFVSTATESVLNRAGHANLNIYGNDRGAGLLEVRTLGGHLRLGFPDRHIDPTAVKGSATPNGSVALYGSDLGGQINVTAGSGASAGESAIVTFGTAMVSSPGSPQTRSTVHLTPRNQAAYDAGAWVANEGSSAGFKIHTKNTISGTAVWDYLVIQM